MSAWGRIKMSDYCNKNVKEEQIFLKCKKNMSGQHDFDNVGTKVRLSENENYFEYEK